MVVYEAEVVGGSVRGGEEALEVRSFAPDEIPWDALAFRSTREALIECLRIGPQGSAGACGERRG